MLNYKIMWEGCTVDLERGGGNNCVYYQRGWGKTTLEAFPGESMFSWGIALLYDGNKARTLSALVVLRTYVDICEHQKIDGGFGSLVQKTELETSPQFHPYLGYRITRGSAVASPREEEKHCLCRLCTTHGEGKGRGAVLLLATATSLPP